MDRPRPLTEKSTNLLSGISLTSMLLINPFLVWQRIQSTFEPKIRKAWIRRIQQERQSEFERVYQSYLSTVSPREWPTHPSAADALEYLPVRTLIDTPYTNNVSSCDFEALVPQLPSLAQQWQEARKQALRTQVTAFRYSMCEFHS
jgi:hypothetical protein